jgi:hypothetical protein
MNCSTNLLPQGIVNIIAQILGELIAPRFGQIFMKGEKDEKKNLFFNLFPNGIVLPGKISIRG